jgi:hypothetical protein
MMEADNIFTFPDLMASDTDAWKQVVQGTRSPALHNEWKEQPQKSPGRLRKQMMESDISATFPEAMASDTDASKQVVQGTRRPALCNEQREQPRKSHGRSRKRMMESDVSAKFPEMTENEAGINSTVDGVSIDNEADISATFPDMAANEAGVNNAIHDILKTDVDCIGTDPTTDVDDIAAIPIADIDMNETSSAVYPSMLKFSPPLNAAFHVSQSNSAKTKAAKTKEASPGSTSKRATKAVVSNRVTKAATIKRSGTGAAVAAGLRLMSSLASWLPFTYIQRFDRR